MKRLWSTIVNAAARPLGLAARADSSRTSPGARPKPDLARVALVHTLSGKGLDQIEIARQTRMSQDTIAMLLNLAPLAPAESAGRGTFFRILETRMAGHSAGA